MPPAVSELLHGSPDPLPERVTLVAGPISVVYEAGDLRSIRFNGVDVINRIYGAIRDHNWATIPGRRSELVVEAGRDSFRVTYLSEHIAGPVDFAWRAEIAGTSDGEITFAFDGEARAPFARNRIGLCVLHPLNTCAGREATVRLADGATRTARFPVDVSIEQPVVGFDEYVGARWPLSDHVDADLTLEGDLFETEDQRNWIDPTFKTFSTPLRLPRPVQVEKGTRIRQRVVLRIIPAEPGSVRAVTPAAVTTDRDRPADVVRTPGIGVAVTHANHDPSEIDRLRTLGLAHVRVDLAMGGDWESRLAAAAALGSAIGSGLELALDVGDGDDEWLRRLADTLPDRPAVARVLVFGRGALITTPSALDAVATTARRPPSGPRPDRERQPPGPVPGAHVEAAGDGAHLLGDASPGPCHRFDEHLRDAARGG